jgi:hypothetical protein
LIVGPVITGYRDVRVIRVLRLKLLDRTATLQERLDGVTVSGFQWHHLTVLHPPLHRFTQALTLEIRFVAQRRFVLLLAVRGLVATSLTAVQAALVAGLELGATDRTVLLVNLPRNILVLVATGCATENAAQLLERLQTVLALGAAGGLQTDVRLVTLHRLETGPRTELVVHTALRKERRTLRTLNLLRSPAHVVLNAPRPCGFVVAILVAVLGVAVPVIEHALTLGAPFHRLCSLFTAQIFGATFHAAMSMGWTAWCECLPAPDAGFRKVLAVLFTCHGVPFAGRNDRLCYQIPRVAVSAFYSCRNQSNSAVLNRDMSR